MSLKQHQPTSIEARVARLPTGGSLSLDGAGRVPPPLRLLDLARNPVMRADSGRPKGVGVGPGDIVRLEQAIDGTWFYCRVDDLLEDGELLCTVVDTQSWPNLVLGGILPGRQYAVRTDFVLSVVHQAQ